MDEPITLVMLNAAKFNAMAFIKSSFGTSVGTMLWRTGSTNDHATEVSSVNAKTCQTRTKPTATRLPIMTVAINVLAQHQNFFPIGAVGHHAGDRAGNEKRQSAQPIEHAEQH
jgi:hypothetical protein